MGRGLRSRENPWNGGQAATHHVVILHQHQVVGAEGRTEDDARDPLEAVDPLLPLRPLPSHVKHPEGGKRPRQGWPPRLVSAPREAAGWQ